MASILLLDDEDVLRLSLAELLEEDGHSVIQGDDGLKAFDLTLISEIDLMITDLFMPHIDGMNAIMSAHKDFPSLKIIAMSGGADFLKQDFLPHTREFGATTILRKPFKPRDFRDTVRTVLAAPAHGGNVPTGAKIAC